MADTLEGIIENLRNDSEWWEWCEEAICQGVLLPILHKLGWDRDNVREVVPQFAAGRGRVDYCLRIDQRSAVFIEAKRAGEDLQQHQQQLLQYAFEHGVELAVLTSGKTWWLYLPLEKGEWEERRFLTIDIHEQDQKTVCENLARFLGRDSAKAGTAVKEAKELLKGRERERRIQEAIPKAWADLLRNPNEQFIEIFADIVERISGHRPSKQQLVEFVSKNCIEAPIAPSQLQPPAQRRRHKDWTGKRPIAYILWGTRYPVALFKEILPGVSSALAKRHPDFEQKALAQRGYRKPWFCRAANRLDQPAKVMGTSLFVETKLGANQMQDRVSQLLRLFGHSESDLCVEFSE